MECITYCPGRVSAARPSVVALGFFDGVHLGHRALLRLAREKADGLGLPLSVFTFPAEDENIKASDCLLESGFTFTCTETGECDVDEISVLFISCKSEGALVFAVSFITPFFEIMVNFCTKFFATG